MDVDVVVVADHAGVLHQLAEALLRFLSTHTHTCISLKYLNLIIYLITPICTNLSLRSTPVREAGVSEV